MCISERHIYNAVSSSEIGCITLLIQLAFQGLARESRLFFIIILFLKCSYHYKCVTIIYKHVKEMKKQENIRLKL